MKYFLLFMLLSTISEIGYAEKFSYIDPQKCLPTVTENDFLEPGLFGSKPIYSEIGIELINYVNCMLSQKTLTSVDVGVYGKAYMTDEELFKVIGDKLYTPEVFGVDLTQYGVASGTSQELFDILGGTIADVGDPADFDLADWDTSKPTSVVEAIDRLVKAYNTAHPAAKP